MTNFAQQVATRLNFLSFLGRAPLVVVPIVVRVGRAHSENNCVTHLSGGNICCGDSDGDGNKATSSWAHICATGEQNDVRVTWALLIARELNSIESHR